MKTDKIKILILSFFALICAVSTFLLLINYNLVYYFLGKFAIIGFLVFPIIALAILIISTVFVFRNSKVSFITPASIAIIGCILAFSLSNDASVSKIEGDFLKHENAFNKVITVAQEENLTDGIYEINEDELKFVVPVNKLMVTTIENYRFAYFVVALETEDRYEGYVYMPHGAAEDWYEYGQFSDPLDIEKEWYYMSLLKVEGDLL